MRPIAAMILGCAAWLTALPFAAVAADAPTVQGLVRSAWYWQARARPDKAEEAWRAVLAADAEQPDALAAIGGLNARAGRMQQARSALEHLRKVSARHPDVAVLQRQIELGSKLAGMLGVARKLVHQGRVDQGIARYREIFGGAGPPGDLALEYFETLGGTTGGWGEAREGLQRLVARAQGETRFRLALAKLLTYRGETRREGIAMLADLSRDPTVSREATAGWRKALLWLGGSPDDEPLLQAYVKLHPRDAAVARTLEKVRRGGNLEKGFAALDRGDTAEAARLFEAAGDGPEARRGRAIVRQRETDARRKAGFAALDRGDVGSAERIFKESGGDAATRLGLALVAQREAAEAQRGADYPRAQALLERARTLAPHRPDIWEPGLRSVEFWRRLDEGRAALRAGQHDSAERKLKEALDHAPPQERWNGELSLADLAFARGDRDRAAASYRGVLEHVPGQLDARRGLATILVQQGRFDEAIPLNDELFRTAPDKAFRPGWLRAEAARSRATRARAANDLAAARSELEAARRHDPANAWVLHDLSSVLLETGDVAAAKPAVEALMQAAPAMPEAQVVRGRLLAAAGDDAGALAVLSALPDSVRDPGLVALQRRLEVQVRVPAILERARGGAREAAVDDLVALERRIQDEPPLAGAVALAWARMGELGRAVTLMRHAIARSPQATQAMRLELASTLLEAGDDPGATTLLSGLEHEPKLTAHERRWLADLRISQAVRGADGERARGDARAAYAKLASVLRDYPDDPRVLSAHGRLLEPEDPRRAHSTYVRALAVDGDDVDARRGAVDTALLLGDRGEARRLAAEGARRVPRDPRVHLLVARAAVQEGDDPAAMRALRQAQALEVAAASSPRATAGPAAGATTDTRAEIRREMERVQERHRSGIGGSGELRVRRGEPGLSALTELRQTAAAEIAIGYGGRATFSASHLQLDAGRLGGSAAERFGSARGAEGALRTSGTALQVGYEGRALSVEAGTTPIGFLVRSLVGRMQLRQGFGPLHVGLEAARRSVTDSLLSYAGLRDPVTERVWGGVVTQGGRIDLALQFARSRYYAHGAYDWLTGTDVAENRRATAGLGAEATLGEGRWGAFTVGLDALGVHHDRNLRYFTLGHGGYFSPQRFARGSIPLGWRKAGRVRWELVAAPGVEWFEEAQSPAFPAVPGAASPDALELAPYPGQRVRGFTVDARALMGWSFAKGFELLASGGLHAAPEFREYRAGLVLRYGSVR